MSVSAFADGAERIMEFDHAVRLPAEPWDEATRNATLFSTQDWLRMREAELPADATPRYFLRTGNAGESYAAAYAYAFTRAPHPLYDPVVLMAGSADLNVLKQLSALPVVIGSGWSEFRGEFLLGSDQSPEVARSITGELARAIAGWVSRQQASYLAFYYLPLEAARSVAEEFGAKHALVVFHDIEAVVVPQWSSFESLLADLGRDRRGSIRRELRSFAQAGRRIRELDLITAIPSIAPLNSALMNKYGHEYTVERARAVFERQAALLNHRSSVLLAEDAAGSTGFLLRYRNGRDIYARVAGFDYDRPNYYDYFALLYWSISNVIDSGAGTLQLGQGSMDAKLRRGATPFPLYNVLVTPDDNRAAQTAAARDLSRMRLADLARRFGVQGPRGIDPKGWLPDF